MSIKAKILSLVLAFALLAAAITALGLKTMADYKALITEYRAASLSAFYGERLNRYVLSVAVESRGLFLARTDELARERAQHLDESINRLEAFLKAWKSQLKPGELPEFEAVGNDLQNIVNGVRHTAMLGRTVSQKAADAYGNHVSYGRNREVMQAKIDTMVARIQSRLNHSLDNLNRFEAERMVDFVLMAVGGTVLLFAGAMWVAIGSVATPLRKVTQSIVKISEGAYDTPLPADNQHDEIGQIWGAVAILKDRAIEADRLTREELEREHKLRELVLD